MITWQRAQFSLAHTWYSWNHYKPNKWCVQNKWPHSLIHKRAVTLSSVCGRICWTLYFIFLLFPFHFVIQQGPSGVCMTSKRGHNNKSTNIQNSEQNFNLTSSNCSPIRSLLTKKDFYLNLRFPFVCCQSVRVGPGSPLHLPVSRLLAA